MPPQARSEFLSETQRFWEERTRRPVSEEDAQETIRNVAAFFDLLAEWDQETGSAEGDDLEVIDRVKA